VAHKPVLQLQIRLDRSASIAMIRPAQTG
jgi:hypothetical protein